MVKGALRAALKEANPRKLIHSSIRRRGNKLDVCGLKKNLNAFDRILVVGGGKASGAMAAELEKIVPVDAGAVAVLRGTVHKFKTEKIKLIEAGHPRADSGSLKAAKNIMKLAKSAGPSDLVFCLLSGGGSALLSLPAKGIALREKNELSMKLMQKGADINELNVVRRHLSAIKGGGLAKALSNAGRCYSLILSDVVGNELASIASGPTAADPTRFSDAARILKKYKLWSGKPRRVIEQGMRGKREETLKELPAHKIRNFIIGSNHTAILAACQHLASKGVKMRALADVKGEARTVASEFARMLSKGHSFCAGGETTVVVQGKGKGGRNQELALEVALKIAGKQCAFAAMGTDGIDGQSKAAGAIVDGTTIERAKKLGLDARAFLRNNDSNSFFKKLKDEIITGPTGTNVNDLMIGLSLSSQTR
ncbi:glycerate kinase [Candidatus Micrarchaeota archaeon]|nr:MAG: glycerate kinase [Candidatus Micrarchaeota archaeon]